MLLEIPEQTKRRSIRVQNAARLYIYKGVTCIEDLMRETKFGRTHLTEIRDADDWDGFIARLHSKSITPVFDSSLAAAIKAESRREAAMGELRRQEESITTLTAEIQRVLVAVQGFEVGSKGHASALSAVVTLRRELDELTGLGFVKRAMSAVGPEGPQTPSRKVVDLA
jgi:hypothetical protein